MSLLRVAAPLASLFFFSAFAVAQIYAPRCKSATLQWAFNSLGQSPCDVTAIMMSTCWGGRFDFDPLPPGYVYGGPQGGSQATNLCLCSTVGYSLYSACGACQREKWVTWSKWATNCTKTLPPGSYPNPVPPGTLVPHWALLDVRSENNWNPNRSYAAGNSPEVRPGSILGPSGVSAPVTPTSYPRASSTSSSRTYSSPSPNVSPTPSPSVPPTFPSTASSTPSSRERSPTIGGSSSSTAAIAGGAIGGVALTFMTAFATIFCLRRRSRAQSAMSGGVGVSQANSQPHMDEIPRPQSDGGTLVPSSLPGLPVPAKIYDPDDSTTFQWYQGPHSVDSPSQIGNGNTLAYSQTSPPTGKARGYHGLPMV